MTIRTKQVSLEKAERLADLLIKRDRLVEKLKTMSPGRDKDVIEDAEYELHCAFIDTVLDHYKD